MQRRNFLGLITAGAAMQFLPALAVEAAPLANRQVWTAASLAVEMEKMFACRMGPAMAFFEMVKGTDKIVEVKPDLRTEWVDRKRDEFVLKAQEAAKNHERFIYHTYGFAIEGGEAWEAEHRLAKHFFDEFSKVENKHLVWRRKPEFQTQEVVEYGDTWMTREALEDRPDLVAKKPENVEQDFLTGNYRYVTRRYPLHKMTMRLVFTDQRDVPVSMARQEGAPLPRI